MENSDKCCTPSRNTQSSSREAEVGIKGSSIEGMVKLPGGSFLMGTESKDGFPEDGEGPVRETNIDPFWVDKTTVTNAQFAQFIRATDYKTDAERYNWSFVFENFLHHKKQEKNLPYPDDTPWWKGIEEAFWKKPEGLGSNIDNRMDHPVVHISWNDAMAYCKWIGKRLPTEAEREYMARGGLEQKRYPWGDELTPNGEHRCNIWQGTFPEKNTRDDGYIGTAPARSYKPNGFDLYNISGNVWEWTQDWFSTSYPLLRMRDNPQGPGQGEAKVIRGGSYLCHKSYCNRYRVAARSANTVDSSTGNLGFRCVKDV
jgi:formylglycine-generating enzyme required for sulfatase activity